MNKILVCLTVISATLMLMSACSKEEASQQPLLTDELGLGIDTFYLSDTLVKRGQTVDVGFTDSSWTGEWTVEPDNGTKIYPWKQTAKILFTQPGLYTIIAKATNGDEVKDTVRVTDNPYVPPVHTNPFDLAADDTITLEPMPFKDDVLVFYASSKKSYSCWALLLYQNSTTSTGVNIDFVGVPNTAAINCLPGPYPAPSALIYTRGYANGTHNVTIRVGHNLNAYTGTVTITDDKYIFNWPADIPVVIAPQQVDRVK